MSRLAKLFGPDAKYPLVRSYQEKEAPELEFIAGPCSVENLEQIYAIACKVRQAGATMLRGGCYVYGTYPPENSGFVADRSLTLSTAADGNKLPWIVEVMDAPDMQHVTDADWIQIGMRHAQHYPLLKAIASYGKKVLLKRGSWMTVDETLGAIEYLLQHGAEDVAICERGIVSFEDHCRWSFSASFIAMIKEYTALKIVADPSHGSGDRKLVPRLARAGVAAGADGVLCEVHSNPDESVSDAEQAIDYDTFEQVVKGCKEIKGYMYA